MAVIYGLRHKDEQQYFYVGSTKFTALRRFTAHMTDVRLGYHANRHFVNKVKKLGVDNVTFDVLQEVDAADRYVVEQAWIEELLGNGHKLVNRMYVDIDPYSFAEQQEEDAERTLTPERFRQCYQIAQAPPPTIQNQSLQWLADALHGAIGVLVDTMIKRFPVEVESDFGFSMAQENARKMER